MSFAQISGETHDSVQASPMNAKPGPSGHHEFRRCKRSLAREITWPATMRAGDRTRPAALVVKH